MLTIAVFPALLPIFINDWALTKTDAGWINGVYYLGYLICVPILVSLTDREPARTIYIISMSISAASGLGFALLAKGFWTAMLFRALGGIGLAGTYMPGLRILTERLQTLRPGANHSRAVALYTASFGIGMSLSYFSAGLLEPICNLQGTLLILGFGPLIALFYMLLLLPSDERVGVRNLSTHLLDFRPVFNCKPAMGYVLAYTVHNFELFAFRSWIVSFLAFVATRNINEDFIITTTTIAACANLVGLPASILGNELSLRIGRHRAISIIMWTSTAIALGLGFLADAPLWLVTAAVIFYGVFITGDSSSITAGTVAAAPTGYTGATLAVHSCIGFIGAFAGPLVFGAILDATVTGGDGGTTVISWAWAFGVSGMCAALGPIFLQVSAKKS
tara:strand:+ start:2359 stop:3531 length:1173 start_codon:yes stop_codon:yes gene_type:complete